MLASCDDRGSAPSGGSGLTVKITLPNRVDYPTSGSAFSVAVNTETAAVSPKSVAYTAKDGDTAAFLTATGIPTPEGGFGANAVVTVSFTDDQGIIQFASAQLNPGFTEATCSIGATAFNPVPGLAITVNAPTANTTLVLPNSYSLSFESEDGDPIAYSASGSAVKVTAATEDTPAKAVISIPAKEAMDLLGLTGSYTVKVDSFAVGTQSYAGASESEVTLNPASPTATATVSLVPLSYIEVGVPAQIQPYQAASMKEAPQAVIVSQASSVSYAVLDKNGDTVDSGTVAPSSLATDQKFNTASVIPAASEAADYTVNVTATYKSGDHEVEYLATQSAAKGPTFTGATVNKGTSAAASSFAAQVARMKVTLSGLGSSWPTNASQYLELSYIETDANGNPVAGATSTPISLEGVALQASQAPALPVVDYLSVGTYYLVNAKLTTGAAYWSGAAITRKTEAFTSSNEATAAVALTQEGTTSTISLSGLKTGIAVTAANLTLDEGDTLSIDLPLSGIKVNSSNSLVSPIGSLVLNLKGGDSITGSISGITDLTVSTADIASGVALSWAGSITVGDNQTLSAASITGTYSANTGVFEISAITLTVSAAD